MDYFNVRRDAFLDDNQWWGDDCLAAYQFIHANSESAARVDLTGNGYNLSKGNSPEWLEAKGYFVQNNNYLNNTNLNQLDIVRTIVIRYSGLSSSATALLPFSQIKGSTPSYDITKDLFVYGRLQLHYLAGGAEVYKNSVYPGVIVKWEPDHPSSEDNHKLIYYLGGQKLGSSGVFGASRNDSEQVRMYYNGANIGVNKQTISGVTQIYSSQSPNVDYSYTVAADSEGGHYVAAMAFYETVLSADRQLEVYTNMMSL